MSDNRAFGYVYGSPENGHRFFGIKTEKAAGQVVVAMRDLFQVVFEMKKKEIDEAKQNMESESLINVGHQDDKTIISHRLCLGLVQSSFIKCGFIPRIRCSCSDGIFLINSTRSSGGIKG